MNRKYDPSFTVIEKSVCEYENPFELGRRMDGGPPNHIVPKTDRLIPRAKIDTATATCAPFFTVDRPESQASFGMDVPFAKTGVVV